MHVRRRASPRVLHSRLSDHHCRVGAVVGAVVGPGVGAVVGAGVPGIIGAVGGTVVGPGVGAVVRVGAGLKHKRKA